MTYQGFGADLEALENAIEALPTQCLYHGDKIDCFSRADYDGACCQSGKPALYRRRAEVALERMREQL